MPHPEDQSRDGASPAPLRVPLTQLRRGERAVVDCSQLTGLPEGDRCLLHAMGLHDDCEVTVCRSGAPCIVQVDETRLGLSGDLAARILVTPIRDGDLPPGR